jgi:putative heme-binding domain-containing protein
MSNACRWVRQAIVVFGTLGPAFCAGSANPFANDPQAAEAGRLVFRIYCSPCHGIHGAGGKGPDLTRAPYSVGDSEQAIFKVIADGAPGTGMAAFGGRVTDDNIWRMVSYLREISKHEITPAGGNKDKGEKLFWGKGDCGKCHVVNGRGSRMGPTLSRIGTQRSLASLRRSILEPNAEVPAAYTKVTVVTSDGTKISGVPRGIDNFAVHLVDAAGNYHSFWKDDLASFVEESKSPMPDIYGRLFTPAELDDVLAYLVSLGKDR